MTITSVSTSSQRRYPGQAMRIVRRRAASPHNGARPRARLDRLDPLQRGAVEERLDLVPLGVGGHLLVRRNRPAGHGGLENRPEEAGVARRVEEEAGATEHVTHGPGERLAIGQGLVPAE